MDFGLQKSKSWPKGQGLGRRVQGLRVSGIGFRVQGFRMV